MLFSRIYFGCDHAGFSQKEAIIKHLQQKHIDVVDMGTNSEASVDYPVYAFRVSQAVSKERTSIGILICGTGYGMCIAANKVKGINAVNVLREDMSAIAVEHNNANVLCLSSRFVDETTNLKIIDKFLSANFIGGHHVKRLKTIQEYKD
jgi:ribose 5-phosphate isomerase B